MRFFAGLLILCLSLFSSCTQPRYVYNPPVRNLHYFQEAGQSKLAAHWATGPSRNDGGSSNAYNHGFDLQGAYAISDHWAIMASYYNRKESDNISTFSTSAVNLYSNISYKRNGTEFGASYFTPLSKGKESFFHVDGGIGFANNSLVDRGSFDSLGLTRNYSDKMFRFFFQPGFYTGPGAFQFGLGARIQWQFFNGVQTTYSPAELAAYSLSGLNQIFNFEPYFSVRYGPPSVPWLKGEMQTGFTTVDKGYYVRAGFFSLGVAVDPFFKGTQRDRD
jgi:hypothetical protein